MLMLPFVHQSTSVQIEVALAFLADAFHINISTSPEITQNGICQKIYIKKVNGSLQGQCWDQPSALAGIDRRLLLGSTVGSCWDRLSAFAGIDRKLQGELC
jgi:hypothetical protein